MADSIFNRPLFVGAGQFPEPVKPKPNAPTAPVKFAFFWVPYPTITTSSNWLVSSSNETAIVVCPATLTSFLLNPKYAKTNTDSLLVTFIE